MTTACLRLITNAATHHSPFTKWPFAHSPMNVLLLAWRHQIRNIPWEHQSNQATGLACERFPIKLSNKCTAFHSGTIQVPSWFSLGVSRRTRFGIYLEKITPLPLLTVVAPGPFVYIAARVFVHAFSGLLISHPAACVFRQLKQVSQYNW